MLNETQTRFIELTNKLETIKAEMKEIYPQLESIMADMGVGHIFQDPTTKIVYKVVVPTGTFVSFKTIDYARTRKEGEKSGSLSLKDAKEAGFELE